MNILHKYIFVCLFLFLTIPAVYSTLTTQKITATDWLYRHTMWIGRYLKGDLTPILEYLPLFHFLMMPFVAVGANMVYFQIIFAELNAFVLLWFAYKMEGENAALLFGMMLASSIAFIQISSALMPQAIDTLLFPITILLYLKGKYKGALASVLMIFFMHMIGMVFMAILLFHSLLTKRYKFTKCALLAMLVLLPVSWYYLTSPSYWDYASQVAWELQFITPLWKFFILSGFLTWILFPFALAKLRKLNYKLTEQQLLYAIWVLAFVPLALGGYGVWREISYSIVPLALFVASVLK